MSLKALLVEHGITINSAARAVQDVNYLSPKAVKALVTDLGLSVNDHVAAAKYAVNAILSGVEDLERIATYVYGKTPKAVVVVPSVYVSPSVTMVSPLGEINQGILPTHLIPNFEPVTVRKARRKNGNSGFDRSKAILLANPNATRDEQLKLLVAAGIVDKSAVVYLWRFNKGE